MTVHIILLISCYFFCIKKHSFHRETPPENTGRSIKTLIRNISGGGLPTSPVMSRRPTETRKGEDTSS